MVSLLLQGFIILLVAFVIGLPVGDLLARQVRRWFKRPRRETDRILAMVIGAQPELSTPTTPPLPDPIIPPNLSQADVLPWSGTLTYPASVFGHTTVSTPVRRDHEAAPPADPFISPSLQPPAR